MIIAVDGPAASGKGTIAKALAAHYALPHLDTGLLYRAVGLAVLEAGGDPGSAEDALHAAELGFIHPVNKHRLSFSSGMPADMQELFTALSV